MTGTSFAIRITSHKWNVAAKIQPDRPSGLTGEDEIGEGRMEHNANTLSGISIPDKQKKNAAQAWLPIIIAGMAARQDLSDFERGVIVGACLAGASVTESSTC